MLNLTFVKTFLEVVDTGSFRAAAARLQLAQPTVTQQIKRLEGDLGVSLIRRSHAKCTPTRQGMLLLPHARGLLAAAERARQGVLQEALRIGTSGNIGTYLLAPIIKRFEDQVGAGITISVDLAPNPDIADRLSDGEFDVAVMEWWDGRPGFDAAVWRTEPVVVITAPDHPWASRPSIDRQTLLEAPMISGEPGSGTQTMLRDVFGPAADQLNVVMNFGNTEAVKRAVRAGLGVSLVLASAVEEDAEAGRLHALHVEGHEMSKALYAALPRDMPADSMAAAFCDLLKSQEPATAAFRVT